jgi:uncharacterized membrane protein YfhO
LVAGPGFDPRRSAVVQGNAPQLESRPAHNLLDRVDIARYEESRVDLHTDSATRSLLVLADANYPGWSAYIDGHTAPILTTNAMFRGVELDAGAHEVAFVYEPTSFRIGAAITALALLVGCLLLAMSVRASRRRPPPALVAINSYRLG